MKKNNFLTPGELADKILNPLTTIKGYLELSGNKVLDQETLDLLKNEIKFIEEYINKIEKEL